MKNIDYDYYDWQTARNTIDFQIGGWYTAGAIGRLVAMHKTMHWIDEKIESHDADNAISFDFTDESTKIGDLVDDFLVLKDFEPGYIGLTEFVDNAFHKDMDKFVQGMRDLSISNFKTGNTLGITVTTPSQVYYAGGGHSVTVPAYTTEKDEITLEDIMAGKNYYGDLMRQSYDDFKMNNPDIDIGYSDFAKGSANLGAFEYTSIEDNQVVLETFAALATLALVILTSPCPPLAIGIGAAYGSYQIVSAISGSDILSGRELDGGERWIAGTMGALAFIPVGVYLSKAKWVTSLLNASKTADGTIDAAVAKNALPNVGAAKIDPKKLTEYALNLDHPVGGNKARVFESVLGFNKSNADDLMNQIYKKLPDSDAVLGKIDQYGQRYTVDLEIIGPNGKTATVRTGWILKPDSTTPEMTTLFVK
ncbi:hypothetical protein HCB37_11130 [Listeria booriae]|uniref:DUF6883 domain-containing protein n=1 Tax=Listeria booriae TaxID=1552123 RepID=UPI00162577F8|nr:DUF6883 domain-containing protein [Listeria booriae]MBC2265067.1 hypothetical protein [Listeria booriae]